jgi:uncharacterized protein YgbK (DUF1537 family)
VSERGAGLSDDRPILVLDDDPTGTQTVHGVPVLTRWDRAGLAAELDRNRVVYLLTNSRSLPRSRAVELARRIGADILATRPDAEVISRSDSTLRGHFPAEVDALGLTPDLMLLVPYFGPGGRVTVGGTHHVIVDGRLIPVAETEFARDPVFGFGSSYLPDWVEEKTGRRVRADDVTVIGLDHLAAGPAAVTAALLDAGPVVVSDATDDGHLVTLVEGVIAAERAGLRVLARTAASYVRVRARIPEIPLLDPAELVGPGSGGLVVVGSHVPTTTQQLSRLLALDGVIPVELDVGRAGAAPTGHAGAIDHGLAQGRTVVLFTSRAVVPGGLSAAAAVSGAVCDVVAALGHRPRFMVVKGGITSSDVATRALGVRRAMVEGQLQPGVPVWRLGPETRHPGLAYVVYPGNVGGPDDLATAVAALRGTA